ncbi:MAG: DNA polymerase III subunit chi [Burkholderiales bacterium]
MPAVAFHFNVPDRHGYACRLLRKAYRQGARVVVTGPERQLHELDRLLWLFEPLEFVPHWRAGSLAELPARLAGTPVVLLRQASASAGHSVLVNLGQDIPAGMQAFERVVEIVGLDEAERAPARERWRGYAAQGCAIERHEVRAG